MKDFRSHSQCGEKKGSCLKMKLWESGSIFKDPLNVRVYIVIEESLYARRDSNK